RRRRHMAPLEARPAHDGGRDRRTRQLDGVASANARHARPIGEARVMTVRLDNVSSVHGSEVHLHEMSLTLERASHNGLVGTTRSAKTSLMRLMAGLDTPTSGCVLVDDRDVTGIDVRKRSVAMVYQQFINYPSLSIFENIASPLRVQGRPQEEIERRVRDTARLLKLEPYLGRTPLALSGGQQ